MKAVVNDLRQIFKASVNAVIPENLIRNSIKYNRVTQHLEIQGDSYNLQKQNVYLVGTGKAVQNMAREVDIIMGSKIKYGIISIPVNSLNMQILNKNIEYYEGAKNNLPDTAAEITARKIENLITTLDINDVIIVLISGGGSALLPLPKKPVILAEKTELIKRLANAGADIKELNTVRIRLSDLKGGQLALRSQPATVISLILSDIVGDPLDLIASGPTVENNDDPDKALKIIYKYDLMHTLPESIKFILNNSTAMKEFSNNNVKNYLIGSNKLSISAAVSKSESLNYLPITLSNKITGNVETISEAYAKLTLYICKFLNTEMDFETLQTEISSLNLPGANISELGKITNTDKDLCLILGGEITVEVKGTGVGGRNQQLALEFSQIIHNVKDNLKNYDIFLLSAGTDGIDGPTDAAGGIGYLNLVEDARKENLNTKSFIDNNDSYNFYKQFRGGEFHVIMGHTNTNVMDLYLLIIKKKTIPISNKTML